MKFTSLLATLIMAFTGIASSAVDGPVADLKDLVCTSRWFSVPESFDTKSVEKCKLLVKANPERYEPHALLAVALMTDKQFDAALDEFRLADKFSADVTDREVLASVPYEDVYFHTACRCGKALRSGWRRFVCTANASASSRHGEVSFAEAKAVAPMLHHDVAHLPSTWSL